MKKILFLFFLSFLFAGLNAQSITWSSPPDIISSSDLDASDPRMAMDANGNLVAAWIENGFVISKTRMLNGSWSSPATISNAGASSIELAVDPKGNATIIWLESGILKSAGLPFNGSWSAAVSLSDSGASSPQIAVDPTGNVVAIWVQNSVIQSATMLLNGTWPANPDILSAAGADAPQVSVSATGNVIAVWHSVVNSIDTIFSATKLINGTWTDALTISNPAQNSVFPQIILDSTGNAVAAWYRYDITAGNYSNVIVQSSSESNGSWSTPTDISKPGIRNPSDLILRLACSIPGIYVAAWNTSYDGCSFNVEGAFNGFGTWIPPVNLVLTNIYAYYFDVLAISGYAIGIFMLLDSTSESLIIQTTMADTLSPLMNLRPLQTLSTESMNGYPVLAGSMLGDNKYLAAIWLCNNGTRNVIAATVGSGVIIQPPSNIAVVQSVNNFSLFTEYYNTISWDMPSSEDIAGFFVYRNGILIGAGSPSTNNFIDHNRTANESLTYGVAFFDSFASLTSISTVTTP